MSNEATPAVQFIAEEDLVEVQQQDDHQDIQVIDHEAVLEALAAPGTTIRVPRNPHFTRQQVVQAFQNAFELIGGVPRLAIWADNNPTEFYKMYAKLLPKQEQVQNDTQLIIKHVLPRTSLDEPN